MKSKAETAKELFLSGYNCSQAVFAAFCEDYGIEKETALLISSGFGGGISRLREVCGAVSAMVMVLSLAHGYTDPANTAAKAAEYKTVREVIGQFRDETGSIICRELLGVPGAQPPTPALRTDEYYKKRPCAELVYLAAQVLERHLNGDDLSTQG